MDVGDSDIHLLKENLNKSNPDQLSQIENASTLRLTQDRDLSSMTEDLWHQLYIQKFGVESDMEQLGVPLNWRQIYEDKSKEELTILVTTNTTAVVNRTATTPSPGCLRKSLDQIKKVCETLLKIPYGIVRCIRSNAPEVALGIFILVVVIIFLICLYAGIIEPMVKAFIAHEYIKAICALVFVVFVGLLVVVGCMTVE